MGFADPTDFHVVVPSLPGFAFSPALAGPTTEQRLAALEQHAPAPADVLCLLLVAADHRLAEHGDDDQVDGREQPDARVARRAASVASARRRALYDIGFPGRRTGSGNA